MEKRMEKRRKREGEVTTVWYSRLTFEKPRRKSKGGKRERGRRGRGELVSCSRQGAQVQQIAGRRQSQLLRFSRLCRGTGD